MVADVIIHFWDVIDVIHTKTTLRVGHDVSDVLEVAYNVREQFLVVL